MGYPKYNPLPQYNILYQMIVVAEVVMRIHKVHNDDLLTEVFGRVSLDLHAGCTD